MLTNEQKAQEKEYFIPYHWFISRSDVVGRNYFGYLDLCLSLVDNPEKFLDLGCGDGRFLGELLKKGIKNIYGIDYSSRAVSFAKIFVPEANVSVSDASNLSFPDGFFDAISAIEVFEHIEPEKLYKVIENIKRVMKVGGILIISTPSENTKPPQKHFQHFNKEKIQKILGDEFKIISVQGQGKLGFSLLNLIYKFLDNRFWQFKILSKYYNLKIWPKYFNKSSLDRAERLIVKCKKIG